MRLFRGLFDSTCTGTMEPGTHWVPNALLRGWHAPPCYPGVVLNNVFLANESMYSRYRLERRTFQCG